MFTAPFFLVDLISLPFFPGDFVTCMRRGALFAFAGAKYELSCQLIIRLLSGFTKPSLSCLMFT